MYKQTCLSLMAVIGILPATLISATLTVYPGNSTYVYEDYPVSRTQSGQGWISGLPMGIQPSDIRANGLTQATFFASRNTDTFLTGRIGSTVRTSLTGPTYIFKGKTDQGYLLQNNDGILFVPKESTLFFEKADFPTQGSILLTFSKKVSDVAKVGYFDPDVQSEIRYILDYTSKNTRGQLQADVWVNNLSNRPINSNTVTLKVGSAVREQVRPMRLYAAADGAMSKERIIDEGEIVYDLSQNVTLPAMSQTKLSFLSETPVSVGTFYTITFGQSQETFTPLRRVIRFRNTTGKALAAGELYCTADGVLQRVSQMPVTLQDQFAEIDSGTAYTLLGKKTSGPLSESKQDLSKSRTDQNTITLRNDGTLSVEIEVRDYLPENSSIVESSHPYTRVSNYQVLFKLTLDKGKEVVIRYTAKQTSN